MKKKLLAMLLIAVMMLSGLNGYVSAEAATKLKAPKGVTVKTSSKKVYPVISWKKVYSQKAGKRSLFIRVFSISIPTAIYCIWAKTAGSYIATI